MNYFEQFFIVNGIIMCLSSFYLTFVMVPLLSWILKIFHLFPKMKKWLDNYICFNIDTGIVIASFSFITPILLFPFLLLIELLKYWL